jgi:DNA-directed RNA polymerase specialized sigma24 family protein
MSAKDLPTEISERDDAAGAFSVFFAEAEPKLRRAFVAAYGAERGREAASEALAWAWEHWAKVQAMSNPLGYLYRVGQTRSRRRPIVFAVEPTASAAPEFEPGLAPGLAELTERQRVAVVLIRGFGWTHREVAELTGTSVTTVQNHLERGLRSLRQTLGVRDD